MQSFIKKSSSQGLWHQIPALVAILWFNCSCANFLDIKPDKKLVIPNQTSHLQALLDNYSVVNGADPTSLESSADNFYLPDDTYQRLTQDQQRRYTWQPDFIFGDTPNEWSIAWNSVFISNTVLDNLEKIEQTAENRLDWQNLKGQALLHRGRVFAAVANVWALAYDQVTAEADLGIPLRLDSDFNKPSVRSNLQETYEQIITDLKASAELLPESQITTFRPVKAAAYGLLARVYLSMRQYEEAARYADMALEVNDQLMDFNQLDSNQIRPIERANIEVIFESYAGNNAIVDYGRAAIVPELYESYDPNDLRRTIYFVDRSDGTKGFRANYTGDTGLFTGVATDELYLIRAECYARNDDIDSALDALNTLLMSRWRTDKFVPYITTSSDECLDLILKERRKELVYRGVRWMDIKRLNKEGHNISITKSALGQSYTLPANSPRFALALPEKIVQLSDMEQNPQ